MRYLVYDVAASESGALNVLIDFYNELLNNDTINEWIFLVSSSNIKSKDNIKVYNYPWVKKSWLHRLFFDCFIAKKIVKRENIDLVFSLQNTIIPNVKLKQYVYMHNSLPFSDYKFKFSENMLLWLYQNIICYVIYHSLKKADHIFVQAEWLKKICSEKLSINTSKISVIPPKVQIINNNFFDKDNIDSYKSFFYPATSFSYKDHITIIEALKKIPSNELKRIKVYFTLEQSENDYTKSLFDQVTQFNLPVYFIGKIQRSEVIDYYTKSILLFTSYIESSPLPLSEAKLCKSLIFAPDLDYAHDILDRYNNVYYFTSRDSEALSQLILNADKSMYNDQEEINNDEDNKSLLDTLLLLDR